MVTPRHSAGSSFIYKNYDARLASGMSRAAYARQHGINNTFWYLCRALSADDSRGGNADQNLMHLRCGWSGSPGEAEG
ncbi:hypothetical protein [Escherichia coli]|uniref:hypothetical protein n=2 Tax=Escherichia coli TaxID=562 RepID=UPI00201ADA0A|nr:hypothetical protein [Escherichia coli]